MSARRDRVTDAGMFLVAAAAAVQSFAGQAGLARMAGFGDLAWLLPVAVDVFAATMTRVWLYSPATAGTKRYARRNAIGAIVLAIAGNVVFHLEPAGTALLVVTIVLSAAAPALLGLMGQLHARLSADRAAVEVVGGVGPDQPDIPRPEAEMSVISDEPTADVTEPANHSNGASGSKRERMAAYYAAAEAEGRAADVTGAELDRHIGSSGYGRKFLAEVRNGGEA